MGVTEEIGGEEVRQAREERENPVLPQQQEEEKTQERIEVYYRDDRDDRNKSETLGSV